MTSPDELASGMRRMDLDNSESKIHELTIECPVLDLLEGQDLSKMYLMPPHSSSMREEPDIEKFHLKTSGTDFVLRFPVRLADEKAVVNSRLPEMFKALGMLEESAGKSQLHVATYQSRKGLTWYRFRLITKFSDGEMTTLEAELRPTEWAAVVASCESKKWCIMLRDLISRESDRAYFHVHERLEKYRWYTKQREKQEQWSWETIPDANQLLALNLVRIWWDRRGKRHTKAVEDIEKLSDEEEDFLLPCSHQQLVFVPMLKTTSTHMCKFFACKRCDEPVMQEQDFWYLQRHVGRQKRTEWLEKEALWKQLDDVLGSSKKRVHMYGGTIVFAIEQAIESIKVPESVSPVALNFGDSKEAAGIMERMWEKVGKLEHPIDATVRELYVSLTEQRDRALKKMAKESDGLTVKVLPADWERMSDLWLMRAVKLAAVDGYDGRSIRSAFDVHSTLHQDAEELSKTVDDLAAMMDYTYGLE